MLGINVNELVNIYLTGMTGSGKTTLANAFFSLSDESKLLQWKTTGYMDCTEQVSYYQLDNIIIYDLPGTGSSQLGENINRAALFIPQLEDEDVVDNFEVWNYLQYPQTAKIEKEIITVKQWQSIENQKYVAPDIIIYLRCAHLSFTLWERPYLRHLLKSQKERVFENKVIFVLNIKYDRQQNIIEDAKKK